MLNPLCHGAAQSTFDEKAVRIPGGVPTCCEAGLGIGGVRIPLTTIATLNALLWFLALRGHSDPQLLVTALFPAFVFALGTAVAFVVPSAAQFFWCLAFGAPLAGWLAARRQRLPDTPASNT